MITLNNGTYKNLAQILITAIGERDYYNGTAELETEEFCSLLSASLIIYSEPLLDPADHARTRITKIVPVWWEYRTWDERGETENDFSWQELKKYLF